MKEEILQPNQLLMYQKKIQTEPNFYCKAVLGDTLWKIQIDIMDAIRDYSRVTVKSCHASGKSFVAARIALNFLHAFTNSIVLTTAPTFRQVEDILWQEIRSAFYNARVPDAMFGTMLNTRYDLGDGWFGIGLSTDDPDRFQGYHSNHILVVADEASGIEKNIFDAIEGITSTGYTRVLLIGNPTDPTGYFAETFKHDIWKKITISCFDTPNFSTINNLEQLKNSTEEQRTAAVTNPKLITPRWAYERIMDWGVESPLFQSRVLGMFPEESDDTLIALKYVEKALLQNNPDGSRKVRIGDDWQIGLDVARYGSDRTCFVVRHGSEVIDIIWYQKEDTMKTVGRAKYILRQYPEARLLIDEIGIGAGVVDRLNEDKKFDGRIVGINVANRTQDDENIKFINMRARFYWKLRERFINNEIILIDRGSVVSDLTNLKYKFRSTDGAIQIESKEDLKKRGLRSPDIADALTLAFADESSKEPNIIFI